MAMPAFFALLSHKITSPALSNLFRINALGLIYSKITQPEDGTIRIFLRLPGADVDFGVEGVVEVDHEEEVAFVGVIGGVVVLFDLDTIDFVVAIYFFHEVVLEVDVDEFVAAEDMA